jgi:hypothetical protein
VKCKREKEHQESQKKWQDTKKDQIKAENNPKLHPWLTWAGDQGAKGANTRQGRQLW